MKNKNTIQIYHQRNGQIWVNEFLVIVNVVCRHFCVYSLSDTWEFVIQYFHHCGRNCFHPLCYHHFQNHYYQLMCIKLLVMVSLSVLFHCVVSIWACVTHRKVMFWSHWFHISLTKHLTYMIGSFIVIQKDTIYWTGLPFWDDSLKFCEWGTSSMSEICDRFKN